MDAAGARSASVRMGRPASPGFARGPLVFLDDVPTAVTAPARPTSPAAERARLEAALGAASADLAALIEGQADPDAAAILEFQLELAGDEALAEGAFAGIAAGRPAGAAWAEAMASMAAGYREAEDEYFSARAGDIEDLADRVGAHLSGTPAGPVVLPATAILFARDLTPSRFLATDWSGGQGVALAEGSPTAHVAILARARGVPMAVGFGSPPGRPGDLALLDAAVGELVVDPTAAEDEVFARRRTAWEADAEVERDLASRPAVTADGERVRVSINVGDPAELDGLDPAVCDGIGLVRTEFLFHGEAGRSAGLADEDTQLAAYRRLLAFAGDRPVVVRTLDAGGDKPVEGLTRDEANPFLGLRGVRLSLARPDVFRIQLRALLRAATHGNLQVMVPMVALPSEMAAVRALLGEEAAGLAAAGVPHRVPPLGMMIEVPSAALTLDLFDVDFASIGSNDLVQYVFAASREAGDLGAGLDDAGSEAVIRVIATAVRSAAARGLPLGLCGDAGADPVVLPRLLATGLRSVSVAPAAVGRVKRAIAGWRSGEPRR